MKIQKRQPVVVQSHNSNNNSTITTITKNEINDNSSSAIKKNSSTSTSTTSTVRVIATTVTKTIIIILIGSVCSIGYICIAMYQLHHDISMLSTIQIVLNEYHNNSNSNNNTNRMKSNTNTNTNTNTVKNKNNQHRNHQHQLEANNNNNRERPQLKQQKQQQQTMKSNNILADSNTNINTSISSNSSNNSTNSINKNNNNNPIFDILLDAKIDINDLSEEVVTLQIPEAWNKMQQYYYNSYYSNLTNKNNDNSNNKNSNNKNNAITSSLDSIDTTTSSLSSSLKLPITKPPPPVVVYGMETCDMYQKLVPNYKDRIVAVAGLFNTGTNAMEFHLRTNLINVQTKWQVPWGKHRFPSVRLNHTAPGMQSVSQQNVLPIIIVRDPFHWMQSMCKSPYAAKWKRSKNRCPNLVPTQQDRTRFQLNATTTSFPVTVYFDEKQIMKWDSLIHLYNDWYMQYYINATYPRLIIRFEDMLLHARTIVTMIAKCLGTTSTDMIESAAAAAATNTTITTSTSTDQTKIDTSYHFKYEVGQAKSHGSGTTFLQAILKSGDSKRRLYGLTPDDIKFAIDHLNSTFFVRQMQYSMPLVKSEF